MRQFTQRLGEGREDMAKLVASATKREGERVIWAVAQEVGREGGPPRPTSVGRGLRDRAASSWPDALRSPACYRTPTPDLLARLGRTGSSRLARWGSAPADGRRAQPGRRSRSREAHLRRTIHVYDLSTYHNVTNW